MEKLINNLLKISLIFIVFASFNIKAQELNWPSRPITLVVPYSPGGPADTSARIVANILTKSLGQRVVIDNKPGAATKVAAMHVAKSTPDGYSLLECTSSTMLSASLAKNSTFSVGDFVPISLIAQNPFVMSITKDLPVKTVSEFIQYANLHKGELNLGSLGSNSVEEIMGRWFLRDNGLDLIPVPYKGGLSAAMIDLIAGRIHLMFDAIGNSTPHYRAGKIKILGVATTSRVATIAEVPTLKEQGYPFVNGSWLAICAPKNTPSIIINRLNTEIVAAVESDEFQSKIKLLGSIPAHSKSSEEFKNFINTYLSEWAEMTRVLGVEME